MWRRLLPVVSPNPWILGRVFRQHLVLIKSWPQWRRRILKPSDRFLVVLPEPCNQDWSMPVYKSLSNNKSLEKPFHKSKSRCCNNCPRGDCPRWQLSKGLLSKLTVVQGYFCPRGLLSKEDFCPRWQLSSETFVQGDSYMYHCPRIFLTYLTPRIYGTEIDNFLESDFWPPLLKVKMKQKIRRLHQGRGWSSHDCLRLVMVTTCAVLPLTE